jgi:hypothetical protein
MPLDLKRHGVSEPGNRHPAPTGAEEHRPGPPAEPGGDTSTGHPRPGVEVRQGLCRERRRNWSSCGHARSQHGIRLGRRGSLVSSAEHPLRALDRRSPRSLRRRGRAPANDRGGNRARRDRLSHHSQGRCTYRTTLGTSGGRQGFCRHGASDQRRNGTELRHEVRDQGRNRRAQPSSTAGFRRRDWWWRQRCSRRSARVGRSSRIWPTPDVVAIANARYAAHVRGLARLTPWCA